MTSSNQAEIYLQQLCIDISNRCVGSAGNRAATDIFAAAVKSYGFETESTEFDCIDWIEEGAVLTAGGNIYAVFPSPYSLPCQVQAPLVEASTLAELEVQSISDSILLLRGDLSKEQLMPKNFPFYNPEHHQHLIQLLENKNPLAIIAATSRDVDMVGGAFYPFPMFEDGDFEIPSVYMKDVEGERLSAFVGREICLQIHAQRIPARGCNVIARKGTQKTERVVLFAHIDTRLGTPGAGDNASGVIVMLLLAELLRNYNGRLGVEIVAMNGEDYYCSPGEKLWLVANQDRFDEILLGINVDDVGYYKGKAAYSLYGCTPELASLIQEVLDDCDSIVTGESWYQGDHGLFLIHQIPALAFTSDHLEELMAEITHTANDTPDIIDADRLVAVAVALHKLLLHLDRQYRTEV